MAAESQIFANQQNEKIRQMATPVQQNKANYREEINTNYAKQSQFQKSRNVCKLLFAKGL